jgi:hypothetical protein
MEVMNMTRLTVVVLSLLAISLILSGISDAKIDEKNIMAIWLFDEGKGAAAEDASGKGNSGEINGAKWANGKFGNALSFDGTDDFVEIQPSASLDTRENITISAWIYPTKDGPIVNYQHPGGTWGTHLWIITPSQLFVRVIKRDAAFTTNIVCPTTLKEWHHVATSYDYSSGLVNLFLDGKECSSLDIGVTEQSTHGPVFIGKAPWDGRAFRDFIDEVVIFDVVLTEADIQTIMNKGLGSMLAVSLSGKMSTTWAEIKQQ